MTAVIDGQLDLLELIEAPAPVRTQPAFKVHPLGWHGKQTCGWCGGPGFLGGGACRWPEDRTISIGYQYCQKCVDKYGHPRVHAGGTPLLMMTADEMRIFCRFCRSSWGRGLKQKALDSHAAEHAPAGDGRCAHMVNAGITEPYYAPNEMPWLSGTVIQYPRPQGFGGLYQLRKVAA